MYEHKVFASRHKQKVIVSEDVVVTLRQVKQIFFPEYPYGHANHLLFTYLQTQLKANIVQNTKAKRSVQFSLPTQ